MHVFANQLQNKNHWIGIRLYESTSGGSPVGAKVTLQYAQGQQINRIVTGDSYNSQHSHMVHFGLGQETKVEQISIDMMNGTNRTLKNPEIDRYHLIEI